jgi:hypothetical protein
MVGDMAHPLVFVLAPPDQLPGGEVSGQDLVRAQQQGPKAAFALRLFSAAETSEAQLGTLPWDGSLEAQSSGQPRRMICDAVVPRFDPQGNAMGVYQRREDPDRLLCLDRFPLLESCNETCWFYPTHDGRFLSWERALALELQPGVVAQEAQHLVPESYERSQLTLLWSLLADNDSLTCVGLTYAGQRIIWPQTLGRPEATALWSLFSVDTQAEVSLTVNATQVVDQTAA